MLNTLSDFLRKASLWLKHVTKYFSLDFVVWFNITDTKED